MGNNKSDKINEDTGEHVLENIEENTESKDIKESTGWFKKMLLTLTALWALGWAWYVAYKDDIIKSADSSAIDGNNTKEILKGDYESVEKYDSLSIFRALGNLFENKTNLNEVLFSQGDLDNLLKIYEETKSTLWKHTLLVIHSILKDMIINTFKEWYHITNWSEQLEKLRNQITIFSWGSIEILYKDMPENSEFWNDSNIIITWDLNWDNILEIRPVWQLDYWLEIFDTDDNKFNYPRMFELFEALTKDSKLWDVDLRNQANEATLRTIELKSLLVSANWKINNLLTRIDQLIKKINKLKNIHKEELLDVDEANDVNIKKLKEKHSLELEELLKSHKEEIDILKEAINGNIDNINSYKKLISWLEDRMSWSNKKSDEKYQQLIKESYNKDTKIQDLKDEVGDLTESLKNYTKNFKKLTDDYQESETILRTLLSTTNINRAKHLSVENTLKRSMEALKVEKRSLSSKILELESIILKLKERAYISIELSKIIWDKWTIKNIDKSISSLISKKNKLNSKIEDSKYNLSKKDSLKIEVKAIEQLLVILEQIKNNSSFENKFTKSIKINSKYTSRIEKLLKELEKKNKITEKLEDKLHNDKSIISALRSTIEWFQKTLKNKHPQVQLSTGCINETELFSVTSNNDRLEKENAELKAKLTFFQNQDKERKKLYNAL